jgi:U3 small nucleolar RNA-associated protein 25
MLRESASAHSHILIFVASYLDFVRLRNWFDKQEESFEYICEYSSAKEISRARTEFFHGRVRYLIVTERYHFFRR